MNEEQMSTGAAQTIIRERRTIHVFREESPPRAIILKALELARWAPNHHLTEPWRFYLLGEATKHALVELNAEITARDQGPNAAQAKLERWSKIPGWLVVTCVQSDDAVRSQEDYAACCCAIQNFQLALWEEGIGVKWTTGKLTRDPRFFEVLDISPVQERVVGMLWYGYPAVKPKTERAGLDDCVIERP